MSLSGDTEFKYTSREFSNTRASVAAARLISSRPKIRMSDVWPQHSTSLHLLWISRFFFARIARVAFAPPALAPIGPMICVRHCCGRELGKSNAFSQSCLCSISSVYWAALLCVLKQICFRGGESCVVSCSWMRIQWPSKGSAFPPPETILTHNHKHHHHHHAYVCVSSSSSPITCFAACRKVGEGKLLSSVFGAKWQSTTQQVNVASL